MAIETPVERPLRIALISPCGLGNLGDALIQDTFIQQLRSRLAVPVEFFGMTLNPDDTRRRHKVSGFPLYSWTPDEPAQPGRAEAQSPGGRAARPLSALRFGFRETRHAWSGLRLFRESDLVLVSGGGQLDEEWGGARAHPWALFKWALVAKLARCPVAVSCVGAGSLANPWSARLVKLALRLADHRSFRDPRTIRHVESLGIGGPHRLLPDAAFGFPVERHVRRGSRPVVVGVSPIAYRRPDSWWPGSDAAAHDDHVARLAAITGRLANSGVHIRIFTTDKMDEDTARELADRARDRAGSSAERIELLRTRQVSQLLDQIASVDVVIASRLHAVIAALLLARPVLAVSYNWKVDEQMADAGLGDYTLPILSFQPDDLLARVERMVFERERISEELLAFGRSRASILEEEFDRLADIAGRRRAA